MWKELLVALCGLAVDAADIKIVELPKEPNGTYGVFNKKDGKFEVKRGEPTPRQYRARHLPDFIQAVIDLTKVETLKEPKVFITTSGLVAVMDEAGRRECVVRMDFTQTKAFKTLLKCEAERKYLEHKEFMRMLRLDLDLGTDPAYSKFKVLKFRGDSESDSDIDKTNASMGKTVMLKVVAGSGDVPDSINVHFPLYEELNLDRGSARQDFKPKDVECLIDVDLEDQVIALIPRQMQLATAVGEVFEELRTALEHGFAELDDGSAIPVYIGSPG